MTKQEFLNNFYLQMDKLASQALPGYEPPEISAMATEAQELLVVTYYTGNNTSRESFEQTEKRIEDLGELVKHRILPPLAYNPLLNMPNGVFVELPNTLITDPTDYSDVHWFTVYEEVLTSDKCNPRKYVLEINHSEYVRALDNPYNKPNKNKVWRMRVEGRKHELITDGNYTIQSYIIRYIKKPNPIDLTTVDLTTPVSQLSDHIHRELVRKTVEIAVKDIEAYNRMQAEISTNNTYRE